MELTLVRTTKHNEAAQITAKTLPSFELPRTAMYNDLNIAMNFTINIREKKFMTYFINYRPSFFGEC